MRTLAARTRSARAVSAQSRLTTLRHNLSSLAFVSEYSGRGQSKYGWVNLVVTQYLWQPTNKLMPHAGMSRADDHHRSNHDYDKRYQDKQQDRQLFSAQS